MAAKLVWTINNSLAAGRGATFQEFVAVAGKDKLEIDVAAWGGGHLLVNGRQVAHAKDRRQAFRDLEKIAGHVLKGELIQLDKKSWRSCRRSRPSCSKTIRHEVTEGTKP